MLDKFLQNPDTTLTMTLLKSAIGLIVAGGMAYGSWIYSSIAETSNRVNSLEKSIILANDKLDRVNDKLDAALADIEFHHKMEKYNVKH